MTVFNRLIFIINPYVACKLFFPLLYVCKQFICTFLSLQTIFLRIFHPPPSKKIMVRPLGNSPPFRNFTFSLGFSSSVQNFALPKATDTRAILFWRWQCNGGKIVALPSRERNACVSCSATATQSCAQSLPKFQIIGFSAMIAENWEAWSRLMNDTFLDQPMKSVMKTYIAPRQRNAVITHCVTIAAKILLLYPKLNSCTDNYYMALII